MYRLPGGYLEDVLKVSDWCLLGIKNGTGGYKECLEGCLESVKIFDPNFFAMQNIF